MVPQPAHGPTTTIHVIEAMPKSLMREQETELESQLPDLRQVEFALVETQRLFVRVYKSKFAEKGLRFTQSAMLNYLAHHGPMTQTELAAAMHLGRPAVGDLIDQLEAQKLLERASDPQDRRIRVIKLTKKGEEQLRDIDALAKELGLVLRKGITKEERRTFLSTMEKLRANLNQLDASRQSSS
jgi:DNA-binding MarR family transcriptional regulator